MMECGGFITVEHMRRGMRPTDAALETLKRIVAKAPARFLMRGGLPRFSLTLYAVNKRGEFGAAALYPPPYYYGYGWGHGPFDFIGFLFFLLIGFFLLRLIFFRGMWGHGWRRGSGRFEEWHKSQHEQDAKPPTTTV